VQGALLYPAPHHSKGHEVGQALADGGELQLGDVGVDILLVLGIQSVVGWSNEVDPFADEIA